MAPRKKPTKRFPVLKDKKVIGYGTAIIYSGKVKGGSKIEIRIQLEDRKE